MGVTVERLDQFDVEENAGKQAVLVDTKSASVLDIVNFRVDFAAWLASLSRRDRRIAASLALGNRPGDVAQRFEVSAGRVSQLRRQLAESWKKFTGTEPPEEAAARFPGVGVRATGMLLALRFGG